MISEDPNILMISSSEDETAWTLNALSQGGFDRESVVVLEAASAAVDHIRDHSTDVVILCMDAGNSEQQAMFRDLLSSVRALPFLIVTPETDEQNCVLVLAHGAHDCIVRDVFGARHLGRAVRYGITRQMYSALLERDRDALERTREEKGLDRYCPRSPLTASQRSLGLSSLQNARPEEFEALSGEYKRLLELAFEQRAKRTDGSINENISAFSDRLGLMRASPQDVVDLHKRAMNSALEGQASMSARAIIDEGRFFLVRILGYLVSFYRHLCEDTKSARYSLSANAPARTKSSSARRGRTA